MGIINQSKLHEAVCPECKNGKHQNCDKIAFAETVGPYLRDVLVACQCVDKAHLTTKIVEPQ